MKILLVNGSPKVNGCTYTALSVMADEFKKLGFDSEIYHIGTDPISPCRACRACAKLGRCIINDSVNAFVEKASSCDGFVLGSPVHYASASGCLVPFMDRVFYSVSASGRNSIFRLKPGTAIVCARRAGTTATIDQINKYFQISEMPVISGRYWNMVHGNTPEQVLQDEEGMQVMRELGRNMAWLLKCIEAGRAAGIPDPVKEKPVMTNFIR